jgi:hypothetical protein
VYSRCRSGSKKCWTRRALVFNRKTRWNILVSEVLTVTNLRGEFGFFTQQVMLFTWSYIGKLDNACYSSVAVTPEENGYKVKYRWGLCIPLHWLVTIKHCNCRRIHYSFALISRRKRMKFSFKYEPKKSNHTSVCLRGKFEATIRW